MWLWHLLPLNLHRHSFQPLLIHECSNLSQPHHVDNIELALYDMDGCLAIFK